MGREPTGTHSGLFSLILFACVALQIVTEEADSGGAVRGRFGRRGLESPVQHRSDLVRVRHEETSTSQIGVARCASQQHGGRMLVAISRCIQPFEGGDEAMPRGRSSRDITCSTLR